MSKEEKLVEEIKNNFYRMNYSNLCVSGGYHVSTHVGLDAEELISEGKKRKGYMSSFFTENDFNIALDYLFNDNYSLKQIAKWLLESKESRMIFRAYSFEQDALGIVLGKNGAIWKTNSIAVVLQKLDDIDDRNITTGMPFNVITMYLEKE